MATLDVQSLFTKVPLNEAINNCVSDLHNNNLYDANPFLCHYERESLDNCPIHFKPIIH